MKNGAMGYCFFGKNDGVLFFIIIFAFVYAGEKSSKTKESVFAFISENETANFRSQDHYRRYKGEIYAHARCIAISSWD